jgi:hypothetical protein
MKAGWKPDGWQKKLLMQILDSYERTGTYRGDSRRNQNIRVPVEEIFPDYDRDDVSLEELRAFETSMQKLEQISPVQIRYRDKKIRSEFREFLIPAGSVEPALYELAGRKPKREIHASQVEIYEKYRGRSVILDAFIRDQEELLLADKNAWFEPDVAENVMQTVDLIVKNTGDLLYRELSILLFGDTKYLEKRGVLSKALRVLKQYGTFDFTEADFDSKKEYEEAILAEYAVYENPTYVNFNGDGEITFTNGTRLELKSGIPIALRSDCLSDIASIRVQTDTVLTIENLTSYNRLQTGAFQLYLAGYHNRARQEFLIRIHDQNPEIRHWRHFGDLDPDGFCILENLRNKTGIDFAGFQMDLSYLKKYRAFTKSLNENDRTKAENLIQAGKYTEILHYMLENNCKLEQEIISWKER